MSLTQFIDAHFTTICVLVGLWIIFGGSDR